MTALPQIDTARLRLRPIATSDVDAMHAIWLEPDVLRYLCDGERIPRSRMEEIVAESANLFRERRCGFWCVEKKPQHELVGFAAFWFFHEPPVLELMYGLSSSQWGKGFASEASRALLRYGFENLALEEIYTSTDVPNTASVRVMERVGFSFDRRTDEGVWGMLHYRMKRSAFHCPPEPFAVASVNTAP